MTFVRSAAVQAADIDHRSEVSEELSFTVSGDHTPMIAFQLDPGEGIICRLSGLMQCDAGISFLPRDGVSDEIMLAVNSKASGPAGLMVSAVSAGQAGVFDLAKHGGHLLCPQRALLATGPGVSVKVYSRFRQVGSDGFDLLLLAGDGLAFLRAGGDVTETRLAPGRQTRINIEALAAMSATVDFDPHGRADPETGVAFARLTGPGQVWLQSGVLD